MMWRIPAVPTAPSTIHASAVKYQIVWALVYATLDALFWQIKGKKKLKISEIKFDLVSTFGFKRDGGLNNYKFEGLHICAVSVLIQLRTKFESLPLISKVILTINENA